jgi:hypothetical protein
MVAATSARLLVVAAVLAGVAINAVIGATVTAAAARTRVLQGYDVSIPQCSEQLPAPAGFAVVGVNGGVAFSGNPCLGDEFAWASRSGARPQLYMNLGDPGPQSPHWRQPGPRACAAADRLCLASNYGANSATDAMARAGAVGAHSLRWWLDVEMANTWAGDTAQNVAAIQGAAGALRGRGATVGIYSSAYQWGAITGGWRVALPNWLGGAHDAAQAAGWCGSAGFSGGPVQLVQYPTATVDGDLSC